MNESSRCTTNTTPKNNNLKSPKFKQPEARTKENSLVSKSYCPSTKSNISTTNIIKSLKNSFNVKNAKVSALPIKTDMRTTVSSPKYTNSNTRRIKDEFVPKYRESTATEKKTQNLQTSVERSTKAVSSERISGKNTNKDTFRGTIRQVSMTDNSNRSINSLNAKKRRIIDLHPNPKEKMQKEIARNMANVLSPRKPSSSSNKSQFATPKQKKINNLSSTLFDSDKVIKFINIK